MMNRFRKATKSISIIYQIVGYMILMLTPLNALSLEKSVFYTIEQNPEILQKQENLKSVQKDIRIARSGYFPKLNLSSGYGIAQEEIVPTYRISGEPVQRIDTYVSASLNLFNGFGTINDMRSQKHRLSSAEYNLVESKGNIALRTIEAYVNMMKQKAILAISLENVAVHKEIYEQLKEKDASGFGNASDLGFVSGRLTLAEVNAVVNENNFLQSKVIFETIYGRSIEADSLKEPVFLYTLPKTLKDAALIAFDNNPSIQVGTFNSKSARSNYQKSKALYYPKLNLEIKGAWFDESKGYDYSVNSSYAMVYLTYNLFNGLADSSTVQKEFYNFKQTTQYLESVKRDVTKRLGTSWIAAVKIKRQLELLQKMKAFSKKTKEGYYDEFGIGKRTLIDLVSVNSDYNSARQSYESAKYDYILAQFRILEAMGGIVEYFSSRAKTLKLSNSTEKEAVESVYDILNKMDASLVEATKPIKQRLKRRKP